MERSPGTTRACRICYCLVAPHVTIDEAGVIDQSGGRPAGRGNKAVAGGVQTQRNARLTPPLPAGSSGDKGMRPRPTRAPVPSRLPPGPGPCAVQPRPVAVVPHARGVPSSRSVPIISSTMVKLESSDRQMATAPSTWLSVDGNCQPAGSDRDRRWLWSQR
jgi:hypothetical protein